MDLYEAFGLTEGSIVAVTGGGGKTTLVHALAREAASRGLSAVVTTTTKFTRPAGIAMPPVVTADAGLIVAELANAIEPGSVVVASSGEGRRSRLLGFEPEVVDALARELRPGLIAIEADGSAHRPFKAPGDHEPVVPASSTDVIVCVGLEVLGRELDERNVHRPERVRALVSCGDSPVVVDAETIVTVLTHEEGGRKGVPRGARLSALLNGPATSEHERLGSHIAGRLVYAGFSRAVVAVAHRPGDVRAVVR